MNHQLNNQVEIKQEPQNEQIIKEEKIDIKIEEEEVQMVPQTFHDVLVKTEEIEVGEEQFQEQIYSIVNFEMPERKPHKKIQCQKCEKIFENKKGLRYHKCAFCKICKKVFANAAIAKIHFKIAHIGSETYSCDLCGSSFGYKNRINDHMREIHLKKVQVQQVIVKGHECEYCGKMFLHYISLQTHWRIHEKPDEQRCPICKKVLSHKAAVRLHLDTVHNTNPEKHFKCERCNYATNDKKSLKKHNQVHDRFEQRLRDQPDLVRCPLCPLLLLKSQKTYRVHIKRVHKDLIK